MNSSVFTLDGLGIGFEPPRPPPAQLPASEPVRYRRKKQPPAPPRPIVPLPKNPKIGDCDCRWNGKNKRWTQLCFVGKGKGKGQTRSGWVIRKQTPDRGCSPR